MSFVTTKPDALVVSAGKLQGVSSAMSAQTAAIHQQFVDVLAISPGPGSGRPPKPLPAPQHSNCHQQRSVGRDHRWRYRQRRRSPTPPGWPDRATRRTARPPTAVV